MKKRILSALLTATMLLTVTPLNALATFNDSATPTIDGSSIVVEATTGTVTIKGKTTANHQKSTVAAAVVPTLIFESSEQGGMNGTLDTNKISNQNDNAFVDNYVINGEVRYGGSGIPELDAYKNTSDSTDEYFYIPGNTVQQKSDPEIAAGANSFAITFESLLEFAQAHETYRKYTFFVFDSEKDDLSTIYKGDFTLTADGGIALDELTLLTASATDPSEINVPGKGESAAKTAPTDVAATGYKGSTGSYTQVTNTLTDLNLEWKLFDSTGNTEVTLPTGITFNKSTGELAVANTYTGTAVTYTGKLTGKTSNATALTAKESTTSDTTDFTVEYSVTKTPKLKAAEIDTIGTDGKITLPGYTAYTINSGTVDTENATADTAATDTLGLTMEDQYEDSYTIGSNPVYAWSIKNTPTGVTLTNNTTATPTLTVAATTEVTEFTVKATVKDDTVSDVLNATEAKATVEKATSVAKIPVLTSGSSISIQKKAAGQGDVTLDITEAATLAKFVDYDQYGTAMTTNTTVGTGTTWQLSVSAAGSNPAANVDSTNVAISGTTITVKPEATAATYYLVGTSGNYTTIVPFSVSSGKSVSITGDPITVSGVGTQGTAKPSNIVSVDDLQELLNSKLQIKPTDPTDTTQLTGTWSYKNDTNTALGAWGNNTVTCVWTPANSAYETKEHTITMSLKKQLTMADFAVDGTSCDKVYDGSANLPEGAKIKVSTPIQVNGSDKELSVAVTGTYCKASGESTADANASVATAKYFVITAITEPNSEFYAMPDPATYSATTIGGATINKSTPTFAFGNNSQETGNITAVTVNPTPASDVQADKDGIKIEYQIPVAEAISTHCDCGEGNLLAHLPNCDLVTGANAGTCTCSALNSGVGTPDAAIDKTHVHATDCEYATTPASGSCDCGAGDADAKENDVNTSNTHNAKSCAFAITAASTEWKAWDEKPTDYGSVKDYLDTLPASTDVAVHAYIPTATTNYEQILVSAASAGTLSITAKGSHTSSGGGGGSSSYTVKFDAGKNGKITKGNASTSVSSGSKVASSKIPEVTANEGYKFLGWSLDGKTTVDPTEQKITKSVTFTALYEEKPELNKEDHMAYIKGYADGTFKPGSNITRAEVAAIFGRIIKGDDVSGTASYSDVSASAWYAPYIASMSQYGLIKGYEDGTFRPDASITREEFVAIATRMDGASKAGSLPFSDVKADRWSIDNIYTAYTNGWMKGYEDGTFRPEAKLTRAEAVKAINAMLERSITAESLADVTYNTFTDVASTHWAYYDIIEASNAHQYVKEDGKETWTK